MPRGQYNPQNRTAPCDEPSELTDDQRLGARRVAADWCAQKLAKGEWTKDEAKEALAELMQALGVYPGQEGNEPTTGPGSLQYCSYSNRR